MTNDFGEWEKEQRKSFSPQIVAEHFRIHAPEAQMFVELRAGEVICKVARLHELELASLLLPKAGTHETRFMDLTIDEVIRACIEYKQHHNRK